MVMLVLGMMKMMKTRSTVMGILYEGRDGRDWDGMYGDTYQDKRDKNDDYGGMLMSGVLTVIDPMGYMEYMMTMTVTISWMDGLNG